MTYLDIVTIDGPAGSGKSTVARRVAKILEFQFMDTGAMYRAVALGAVRNGIRPVENEELTSFLRTLKLELDFSDTACRVFLDGEDVSESIREAGMGKAASDFSRLASVRRFCSALQRRLGESGSWVVEGRDMGTVVFPDARWKFFLTASIEERARRRWKEQAEKGLEISYDTVMRDILLRDQQDSNRRIAPLKAAADAMVIDTTDLSIEDVVRVIVENIRKNT